ncbi:hypothetical protein ECTPHS_13018 [Ectothiorhodospira sp. PHS-1]|uniref:hypothetical protein n=1 Tax=Ectothiorhodospira sp. PHS-1 TaxID=519989 RepID=UPI00024A8887|nr:hypothetical protein [Ectothiorhodospira sp. PHS-1]EHQ53586.1 hypothetical protein ECTPHS_13018 [Ectothiorhodospira sp. PHS-1]
MTNRTILVVLALVVFTAGCATRYPLGIPEEQWVSLSLEEQIRAREAQAALDQAQAERRAAEARAREAQAAREQAELEMRRREARYGERVQCVLTSAEGRLGGRWRPLEPLAVDLVQGMEMPFQLMTTADGGRYRGQGHAYFDGTTVSLCSVRGQHDRDPGACARLLGTFEDYRRGLRSEVSSERFIRGQLRCHLGPGAGVSPRRN